MEYFLDCADENVIRTALDYYQMGEFSDREALIMYRTSPEYPKHTTDLPDPGKTVLWQRSDFHKLP